MRRDSLSVIAFIGCTRILFYYINIGKTRIFPLVVDGREMGVEVGHNELLHINDLAEDFVGAHLQ